jgi:alditol oxidase
MKNWSGTYEYRAAELAEPTSIEELQEVVARSPRVRALGTRHSFNPIADTEGVLVTPVGIPADFVIDAAARTVTFGAGTRYGVVAAYLQRNGWALHNMGSLPHISVGGAISTGTHGSGDLNGNLSTAVRALQFVGADGSLRTVTHGDPDFPGSVVALGALGVLVRITLAIEPTYLVRQDVYRGLDWEVFLGDVAAVTGAAYSVSVFSDWVQPAIEPIWVKRRVASPGEAVPDELFGARRDPSGTQSIIEGVDDNTTQHGVAGPWSDHLPHFRIDSTPSKGDEIQSEYFVDVADASDAIRAVRTLGERIKPLLIVTELRTMAADDLWLSQAGGRHSLAIHFTFRNRMADVLALLPDVEAALAPFSPRPHWGKVNTMAPEEVVAQYPRMADFRALMAKHDPEQKFTGPYLERLLGLKTGAHR